MFDFYKTFRSGQFVVRPKIPLIGITILVYVKETLAVFHLEPSLGDNICKPEQLKASKLIAIDTVVS